MGSNATLMNRIHPALRSQADNVPLEIRGWLYLRCQREPSSSIQNNTSDNKYFTAELRG